MYKFSLLLFLDMKKRQLGSPKHEYIINIGNGEKFPCV
jgi:hypothetical protein